jgi:hypothetical protein
VPCLGYVFTEQCQPYTKVVVLGDTSDASAITPLSTDADVLVHEGTHAYMPPHLDARCNPERDLREWYERILSSIREPHNASPSVDSITGTMVLDPEVYDKLADIPPSLDAIANALGMSSDDLQLSTRSLLDLELEAAGEQRMRRLALSNGHSTARMAGEFARRVRARSLFLNHIGTR